MRRRIYWTPAALDDLQDIFIWLDERNSVAADRLVERIFVRAAHLGEHTELGHVFGKRDVRRLVVTGTWYGLYYRYRGEQIEILAVLDGRMSPARIRAKIGIF